MVKSLVKIQHQYESKHNIPAMLENEKSALSKKFDYICRGLRGEQMIYAMVLSGLKTAIKPAFIKYLAEEAKANVEKESYIRDAEVIQAHVDLKLLKLSQQNDTKTQKK